MNSKMLLGVLAVLITALLISSGSADASEGLELEVSYSNGDLVIEGTSPYDSSVVSWEILDADSESVRMGYFLAESSQFSESVDVNLEDGLYALSVLVNSTVDIPSTEVVATVLFTVGDVTTYLQMSQTTATIIGYSPLQLEVEGLPSSYSVNWTSSNVFAATVSDDGLVTPVSAGRSTTITATIGSAVFECEVTVEYGTLTLSPSSVTVTEGSSSSVAVSGWSDELSDLSVRASSDDSGVAACSVSGSTVSVTGMSVGTTTVSVSVSSLYRADLSVTVEEKPATVDEYTFFIRMDYDYDLAAAVSDFTEEDLRTGITISASSTDAASALEAACKDAGIPLVLYTGGELKGWITSMFGLGDVYVGDGVWKYWVQYYNDEYNDWTLGYYTDGGEFSLIYTTTTEMDSGSVVDVSLDRSTCTMAVGGTVTLTATVTPSGATDPSVTWSSSNTAVATVDSGVVTAVSAGTAVITVKTVDGGYTATCNIVVTGSDPTTTKDVTETEDGTVTTYSTEGSSATTVVTVSSDGTTDVEVHIPTSASGDTVTISSADLEAVLSQLSAVEEDAGADVSAVSFVVSTSIGTVELSYDVLETLGSYSGDVTVEFATVSSSELPSAFDGMSVEAYDVTLTAGGTSVHNLDGRAVIALPYKLESGQTSDGVRVYHIADDGTTTLCESTYDEDAGMAYVTVDHLSVYAVVYGDVSESSEGDDADTDTDNTLLIAVVAVVIIIVAIAAVAVVMRRG